MTDEEKIRKIAASALKYGRAVLVQGGLYKVLHDIESVEYTMLPHTQDGKVTTRLFLRVRHWDRPPENIPAPFEVLDYQFMEKL